MYFEYKHNRHLMSMQEVYQYDCVAQVPIIDVVAERRVDRPLDIWVYACLWIAWYMQ